MQNTYTSRIGTERITWGDEAMANLYGTSASIDPLDPFGYAQSSMYQEPEAFNLGPLGGPDDVMFNGAGMYSQAATGAPFPDVGQDRGPDGELLPPVAPAPEPERGGRGLIPGLPSRDDWQEIGSRIGFGTLGTLLVIVGVLALVWAGPGKQIVKAAV